MQTQQTKSLSHPEEDRRAGPWLTRPTSHVKGELKSGQRHDNSREHVSPHAICSSVLQFPEDPETELWFQFKVQDVDALSHGSTKEI